MASRGATPLVPFLVLLLLVLCLLIGARRFIWAVDELTGAAFSHGGLEVAVSSFPYSRGIWSLGLWKSIGLIPISCFVDQWVLLLTAAAARAEVHGLRTT